MTEKLPCLSGKTLLILGGGKFQIPLINKAKNFGLTVWIVDRDTNAPGAKYADHLIPSSITDVSSILSHIGNTHIDAVCTDQTDVGVRTVAELASTLGLKGIGPNIAKRFTNKYCMRELLQKQGLPVPKFIKIKELEEADAFIEDTGFPLIIKPPSSQSSKGVFLLRSREEFITHFPITKNESTEEYVILEEFIEGIEYTVESFVSRGGVYTLAISDKKHLQFNPCVAIRLTYPPDNCNIVCSLLKSMNENAINALGLSFGITHAEFRIRNGIPYLIEIAARGGGTYIASDIIPAISGIDVYELLIRELFSLPVKIPPIQQKAAILDFFSFDEGKILKISGLQEAQHIDGVTRIELNVKKRNYIHHISDDTNRHGFLIATGMRREEVRLIAEEVKKTVRIEYKK
jgi:carbamoyl-phosphate synthase large subunit